MNLEFCFSLPSSLQPCGDHRIDDSFSDARGKMSGFSCVNLSHGITAHISYLSQPGDLVSHKASKCVPVPKLWAGDQQPKTPLDFVDNKQ